MSPVDARVLPRTDSALPTPRIEPALVRVSVLGGNTQLDVALPAAIPVAALIGELLTQIQSRGPRRSDVDDPDADPTTGPHDEGPNDLRNRWSLALIGQEALPLNRSLAESGIRDGDLLMMTAMPTGESPVLFDDVVDAVARLNDSHFRSWSPRAARSLAYAAAIAAAVVGAACIGGLRLDSSALWPAALSGLGVVGLLTAATVLARHYGDGPTATVLSACAAPLAFVTGMLVTPGAYGAAHLAFGFALTLLSAVVCYRLIAVGPELHSAVITVSLLAGLATMSAMLVDTSTSDVAAVVAAVGLLVASLAPRATIVLAKLPLPPVPTAGAAFDAEGLEPAPAIAGIGAIGAIALPKADALERRSYLANAYLTGIVCGTAAVTSVAAVLAAYAPSFTPKAVAYAAIVAVVLCLRGRSHSDLSQATALIVGGSLAIAGLIVPLAFDGGSWPLIGFVIATVLLLMALLVGVLAPQHDFSPVLRRSAELAEYTLVAVIVPLLLWVLDIYQMVRDR